jgi:SAM-dependent methyltransferase
MAGPHHRFAPRIWQHDWHHLHSLRRGIEQALERHELRQPKQRIADFGCGERPYEPLFLGAGREYVACDLDGRADILIEPGRPVPLADESVDGVVSFQVLEHVWDLDWYLGECLRILKPGGWLLLTTHGAWLYHPHPTDFRRWTADGLRGELAERGFVVEDVAPVVGPLAWTTQFRLLGIRQVLKKIPLLGRLLLVPVAFLMNIRMVVEEAITPASIREVNASVYVTLSRKPRNAPDRVRA